MTLPSAYFNYVSDSACPFHRALCPARFVGPAFKEYGWDVEAGSGLPGKQDMIMFHGLPNAEGIVEIAKCKRRGAKFIWSVDDDWLTIPDWNPAKPSETGLAMYEIASKLADYIITSTPYLQSTFSKITDKPVFCAPNLMDLSVFPEIPYKQGSDGRREYDLSVDLPVRITWAGGFTHKEDISIMEDALIQVIDKFGRDKVCVIFYGMAPPSKLLTKKLHQGLIHQPSVPYPAYQQILNTTKPNIYLAPLAKVEFNLSKSNLRIMEGWGLGAVPVATPWGEYECINSGHDGRYANTTEEWVSVLNRLVSDHEYRLSLAIAGYERVQRDFNWRSAKCQKPWKELFAKIFETPVPE